MPLIGPAAAETADEKYARPFPENLETAKQPANSQLKSMRWLSQPTLKQRETGCNRPRTGRCWLRSSRRRPLPKRACPGAAAMRRRPHRCAAGPPSGTVSARLVSLLTKNPSSMAARTARCAADFPMPVMVPICSDDSSTSALAPAAPVRANFPPAAFVATGAARAAIKSTTARTLSVTPWPDVCAKTLEKIG